MLVYIIRRLMQAALVMVVMSAVVFAGIYVIGDPVAMMISPDASEVEREAVRVTLGLDQPMWRQYLTFVDDALHGDFGKSFLAGQPAMGLIFERMPATMELAVASLILSLLIGLPMGVYAGLRPHAPGSKAIMTGSILGFSLPNFWVGLMLIMVFAVLLPDLIPWWPRLPASGRGTTVNLLGVPVSFLTADGLLHLILPALTLAFYKGALIVRLARATAREVLPMDYIKFARAKGLSENRIVGVHVLKNIMIPIATVSGLEFGQTVAFAVVTETVFSWPGMQAFDRFHPAARPAGGGGLPRGHRLLLRDPQSRGRPALFGPRSESSSREPRHMTDSALEPVAVVRPQTPFQRVVSDFCESRLAVFGLVLVAISAFVALFAPWISPQNPFDIASLDLLDAKVPPGTVSGDGKMVYWLGTDGQARDMLSAIFYGMRISLFVGTVSVVVALAIGVVVGLVAAYAGGKVDALLMRIVDLMLSFPAILVALILLSVLGKGIDKVLFALILVQWAYFARAARGAALVERNKEYVEAATCLALPASRIVFRHMLPNCMPSLIVIATITLARAIALEATLSFLGVGVPVTQPSLGMLISNGFEFLLSGSYWISFFPGVALAIAIVGINLAGDQLRDVLNPRNLR
jgi:peptide/nickel transport system permease protein